MTPSDLRQAIAATKDTQINFAARVGCTVGTLGSWLRGKTPIGKLQENAVKSAIKTYETDPPTRIMWSGPK